MSRILKRPMFKMGGSTSAGITSGLSRQGYHEGGSGLSTQERLLRAVGPRRSNVYDFLTEWGLNMASSPPMGNVIQTAAGTARDPYKNFLKGKQDEDNLLRQVALEGESIDIKAEEAKLAAEAEAKLKRELLKTRGEQQKELYEIEKGDLKQQLIETRAQEKIANNEFNNYATAINEATWVYEGSKKYKDRRIGGVLTQKMLEDKKFAKNQKKKNPIGTVYYDPFSDRVLELAQNADGDYVLSPVIGSAEDTTAEAVTSTGDAAIAELIGQKTKTIGTDTVVDKISPQDVGLENKPVFENLNELLAVIKFPMTGKELKAQYEFVFPINEKTTFYPRKNNKKGSSISNSILPGIF
jgi:hypothetical protein